jgi:hypothetical protein
MKNLSTVTLISRTVTLLILGLIAIQPLVVTRPTFAISTKPQGPEAEWQDFCEYYYVDEKDLQARKSDTLTCQQQSPFFARVVSSTKWPDVKLKQLNSSQLGGAQGQDDLQTKLVSLFKNKQVITDDKDLMPTLWDYEMSDKLRDLKGAQPDEPPATVAAAFTVFCQTEQTNQVIKSADSANCNKLAQPFQKQLVLFISKANPTVLAVTKAWLGRTALKYLASAANKKVTEAQWIAKFKGTTTSANIATLRGTAASSPNVSNLISNQAFMDDLWMYAVMELPDNT